MIRLLLKVLAASLCINEPSFAQDTSTESTPWDNTVEDSVGPVVAFVGEKIFVEKRNLENIEQVTLTDGRTVARKIPRWSDRFVARYKVIDVIGGDYAAPVIDFEHFDHYGRAFFQEFNPILLFAINRNGKWVVNRSPFYLPLETTDGDWGKCGSLARPEWSEELQALAATYEEPIGFLDIPKTQAAAEACVTGTRADNIFAFQEKIRFAPDRRRRACNREMGERDNVIHGKGFGPDAEQKARIHAACVSRLEAEDNL